jgi:peptidyl-prolyl cis-trans isomerase SurA
MKNLAAFVNCTFIIFLLAIFLITVPSSFGLTVDKVLATVEDEVIALSDYQHFIKVIGGVKNTDVVNETLLERLIVDKIILHTAVRRGIEVSDTEVEKEIAEFKKLNVLSQKDLEAVLSKEGMTMESYKKRIADKLKSMKLYSMEVESKVIVTDKEIEDYYSDHRKNYLLRPEKIKIKTMLLKLNKEASITEITELKRKALKIATQLQEGGSFESILSYQKIVKGPVGLESGSGEFERGSLDPALDKQAFSMKKGETSDPIWVGNDVYIIQVLNRADASYKPIRDVYEEIYTHLYEQKRENIFNEWVRTLWEKTSVKIY